jgi:hypothetical protein
MQRRGLISDFEVTVVMIFTIVKHNRCSDIFVVSLLFGSLSKED